MKAKPTFAYLHITTRQKKDGTYPVKLRVTFQRKRKYYGTGIDLSEKDWELMHSVDANRKLLKSRKELDKLVQEAEEIADTITYFSFHQFEDKFFNAPDNSLDVYEAFEKKIEILEENKQEGTKDTYVDALKSLKKYKPKLTFENVTPEFLSKYENWMLKEGKTYTTIGIYLRNLRAIFNIAIDVDKVINRDIYPFTKYKYKIPTGKKGKVSLNKNELALIQNYQAIPYSTEDRSKDLFMFSYYCNGMNFKDIFNLKYQQINSESFKFIREKTKLTTKDSPIIIEVQLNEYSKKIIEKWGSKNKNPDNYVFPFIKMETTEEAKKISRKQFTKTTNKYLKRICAKVGISKEVTTYVARHSFAFIVINSGHSIEALRELLGHSDIKTTQNYINDIIPPEKKKKIASDLMLS